MERFKCMVCGYIYDPAENNSIAFSDLPDNWVCPECGVSKEMFELAE
ncbi:MAG: rubredoxin [Candidatus Kaelpia imicola]|nr:rubredoxin [Candidatus Kaelpia imicola]